MKNIVKRLGILMIILSLMQSTVAYAETTADTENTTDTSTTETANEVTELMPNLITKEDDLESEAGNYQLIFSENEEEKIAPVTISDKGGLFVTLGETDTSYYSLMATLYKDEACTSKIDNSVYLFAGDGTKNGEIVVEKSGKYFIKFELQKKNDTDVKTFNVKLSLVSNENKTLKDGQIYMAYQDYDSPAITYKVEVKSAGMITLTMGADVDYGLSAKTQLLNKDKKAISEEAYVSAEKNSDGEYGDTVKFYAVSKGTYYVKVNVSCGIYGICYKFTSIKDASGSSKTKAAALKLGGSSKKGVCLNSDKTTKNDWFKFTLKSSKSIKITIKSKVDGKLNLEIIDPSGRTVWFGSKTIYDGYSELTMQSQGKWSKGTYYIKVYKGDKKSSGYYTVSVK